MSQEELQKLFRDYLKFADQSEALGFRGFTKLLAERSPGRTLADNDLDAWWCQATRSHVAICGVSDMGTEDDGGSGMRRSSVRRSVTAGFDGGDGGGGGGSRASNTSKSAR